MIPTLPEPRFIFPLLGPRELELTLAGFRAVGASETDVLFTPNGHGAVEDATCDTFDFQGRNVTGAVFYQHFDAGWKISHRVLVQPDGRTAYYGQIFLNHTILLSSRSFMDQEATERLIHSIQLF